ncbi:MAG TPA: hypothetical protein VNG04_10920, partial [Candidatus Acidoferrum sp.]|nr:hypothetical protein [Candidatus Acidoferrum sp.]
MATFGLTSAAGAAGALAFGVLDAFAFAGERDLLLLREQRSLGDLMEVLIEDVALVLVTAEARQQAAAPATAL